MDPYDIFAEKYRLCVLDVAKKYIGHLEKDELLNMKQQFEIWKKEPDKLNVNNLYTLSGWRALYTQNLFMSRISTMLLTFRQVLNQPHVYEIMKCIKRVVSIGCGPGPDIAAVLMLLRNNIGVTHFVKVIGIDQFIGWRQYVLSLNKVDLNGTMNSIEFWQLRVEEKTLDKVLSAEMCVMSYTDAAIHTQKFWQGLKQKFSLIVILDQKKGSLTRLLRRENFRMVEYEYKGTKRFFYWVDPRGVKESLSHINARLPSKTDGLNAKTSVRNTESVQAELSGKHENQASSSNVTAHATSAQVDEDGEDDDDDDDDDNSEQQRELAAIFDRLGDIGKMPVAQLNELDEVQRIRNELCRTADSAKDSVSLAIAVKPKQSYRFALEPQKHLSKERKNQLLKAKLRELGVNPSDDEDDEDEDHGVVDGEDNDTDDVINDHCDDIVIDDSGFPVVICDEADKGEMKSSVDFADNETVVEVEEVSLHDEDLTEDMLFSKSNSSNDVKLASMNHITALGVHISDHVANPNPKSVEEGLPILCVSSVSSPPSGSAIPTVDRLVPAFSPPIIIPPLNIHSETGLSTVYPVSQPLSSLGLAYPPFTLYNEPAVCSSDSQPIVLGRPTVSSSAIPIVTQTPNLNRNPNPTPGMFKQRNALKRGFSTVKRAPSLVLLSKGNDDDNRVHETDSESGVYSRPTKQLNSCLGPVKHSTVGISNENDSKRFKCQTSSLINPVSFNRAAVDTRKREVTDLRQLLNIRRKHRSDP